MASKNVVILNDPHLIKEMTVTKEKCFKKNPETYNAFRTFGDNILSACNHEEWKIHHKICSPAFSSRNLQHLTQVAGHCVDEMVEFRWKRNYSIEQGFQMDMKDYSDLTLHILGLSVFGLNFGFFTSITCHSSSMNLDNKNVHTNHSNHSNHTNHSNNNHNIPKYHQFHHDTLNKGIEFRKAIEVMFTRGVILENFLKYESFFPFGWMYGLLSKVLGVEKAIQMVSDQLDEIIATRKRQILNKEEYNHQDVEFNDGTFDARDGQSL